MLSKTSKQNEQLKEEFDELSAFSSIGILVAKMFTEGKGEPTDKGTQEIHYIDLERHKSFVDNIFAPKEKKKASAMNASVE